MDSLSTSIYLCTVTVTTVGTWAEIRFEVLQRRDSRIAEAVQNCFRKESHVFIPSIKLCGHAVLL